MELAIDTGALGALGLEEVDSLLGATHVGALGNVLNTSGDEGGGLLSGNLVLGGAGKGNVELGEVGPGTSSGDVLEALDVSEVNEVTSLELELTNLGNGLGGESSGSSGDESALGVGEGEDGGAELDGLEGGVLLRE